MNTIQEAIFVGSREESGLWEVLIDIKDEYEVSLERAFQMLKDEIEFLKARDDIYLIYSEKLYDSDNCEVIEKDKLKDLTLDDALFKESGPFYYLSNEPGI